MRRVALCVLAIVALCSGQVCDGLNPTGLSLGGPKIPAGIYTGDVTYAGTVSTNGTVIADFEPLASPYTCEFGAAGLPLVDADRPVYVGARIVMEFDGNHADMIATAIRSIGGGIAVDYDVVMKYQTGGTTVDATGSATESFTLAASNGIDYTFDMSADFPLGNVPICMKMSGDGRLLK